MEKSRADCLCITSKKFSISNSYSIAARWNKHTLQPVTAPGGICAAMVVDWIKNASLQGVEASKVPVSLIWSQSQLLKGPT